MARAEHCWSTGGDTILERTLSDVTADLGLEEGARPTTATKIRKVNDFHDLLINIRSKMVLIR